MTEFSPHMKWKSHIFFLNKLINLALKELNEQTNGGKNTYITVIFMSISDIVGEIIGKFCVKSVCIVWVHQQWVDKTFHLKCSVHYVYCHIHTEVKYGKTFHLKCLVQNVYCHTHAQVKSSCLCHEAHWEHGDSPMFL